jgi:hypothetical protein
MFGFLIYLFSSLPTKPINFIFTPVNFENQEFIDKFTINLKNLKLLRYLQNTKYTDFQKINIIHQYNLQHNTHNIAEFNFTKGGLFRDWEFEL